MIIYISLESLFSMTRLWSSGYDRGFPTIFAGIAKIRKQPLTRVRIPAAASNYRGYIQKPQDALPKGVCDIKPINGKILQIAFWESDQFVVLLKQGNSCGGKGLTVEPLRLGHILRTQLRIKDDNKTVLVTYLEKDGKVLLKKSRLN
jgi:hypothetical protein